MRKNMLVLLLSCSFQSYCQENILLPPDSLLKANRVKKLTMKSNNNKNNAYGENVYHYNQAGKLIKHNVMSPFSDRPVFITDYFFDSTGKAYASVFHGGESYNSYSSTSSRAVYTWSSGSADSITYYYEYNTKNKISRAYRNYPSGEPMNETIYSYDPIVISRKSYNQMHQVTTETNEYYEKGYNIEKIVSKKYDDGKEISTSTQDFLNTYNAAGQVTEVKYRNDTCSCISKYEYYPNGLIKSKSNVACLWKKRFKYKYYKAP